MRASSPRRNGQGRIGDFPYDPRIAPSMTAWDIGIDDYTAIWFLQDDGLFATAIDYHETSGKGAEQIVREALPELNPDPLEAVEYLRAAGREQPSLWRALPAA